MTASDPIPSEPPAGGRASRPIEPVEITDLDDPRIELFRNQRDAHLRARHLAPTHRLDDPDITGTGLPTGDRGRGLFMAEGLLVVRRLCEAHLAGRHHLRALLVDRPRLETVSGWLAELPDAGEIDLFTADRPLLEQIVGYVMHRGVLGLGEAGPRPPELSLDAPSNPAETTPPGLVLVLEDLANHDNVGSIFRSMSCLWHDPRTSPAGVLLTRRSCDPFYRKSLRVSMGHALRVPWDWVDDGPAAAAGLRRAGYLVLGASPGPHSRPLESREALGEPQRRVAVVLGAEGPGLREVTREAVDRLVEIHQVEGSDSLNVAVAAALLLDRLRR